MLTTTNIVWKRLLWLRSSQLLGLLRRAAELLRLGQVRRKMRSRSLLLGRLNVMRLLLLEMAQ